MPYRYDYREEHRGLAFFLAVGMHALLAVFLLVSVQWQTRQPETVSVELWGGPPPPPQEVSQAEPEPVRPAVVKKADPEPLPVEKPDIATEKVKPRPTAKPSDKPLPTPAATPSKKPAATAVTKPAESKPAEKAPAEDAFLKALQGGISSRSKGEPGGKPGGVAGGTGTTVGATGTGAGGTGSLNDYRARLIALFKSRLIYPDDKPGNPQVTLRIAVLPDGSIRDVTVLKASSDPAYDDAAVRAVRGVDHLPDPGRGRSFRDPELREFNVIFKLRDK